VESHRPNDVASDAGFSKEDTQGDKDEGTEALDREDQAEEHSSKEIEDLPR
jgi:hypothetical protein